MGRRLDLWLSLLSRPSFPAFDQIAFRSAGRVTRGRCAARDLLRRVPHAGVGCPDGTRRGDDVSAMLRDGACAATRPRADLGLFPGAEGSPRRIEAIQHGSGRAVTVDTMRSPVPECEGPGAPGFSRVGSARPFL